MSDRLSDNIAEAIKECNRLTTENAELRAKVEELEWLLTLNTNGRIVKEFEADRYLTALKEIDGSGVIELLEWLGQFSFDDYDGELPYEENEPPNERAGNLASKLSKIILDAIKEPL